jgi:hypothetical protein
VTAAWIAIVVIALGLPLFAWWVGGRRFWGNLRGAVPRDVQGEMVRKHGLRPADLPVLQRALARGQQVEPRLRPAAVDWARTSLEELQRRRSRARRVTEVVLLLAVLALAILFVSEAGGGGGLSWFLVVVNVVNVAVQIGGPWWMRRNLARAAVLNAGSVGSEAA